jgi:hypothetical protein
VRAGLAVEKPLAIAGAEILADGVEGDRVVAVPTIALHQYITGLQPRRIEHFLADHFSSPFCEYAHARIPIVYLFFFTSLF